MTSKEKFCHNINKYEASMYNLAYSIMRNQDDASEVLSEAICRAYSGFGLLKNEAAFKEWILQIVHNTAVEMIRKNSRLIYVHELADTPESKPPVDAETKITLRDAVLSLKEPYRTVLTLFYYENLSVKVISNILGNSDAAVRQQLNRGRKMLKSSLGEEFIHGYV